MRRLLFTWVLPLVACGGVVTPDACDAGQDAADASPTSTKLTRREAGKRFAALCSEGLCSAPVLPQTEAVCAAEVAATYDSDDLFPCDEETLAGCLTSYASYKKTACEGPSLWNGGPTCDRCK